MRSIKRLLLFVAKFTAFTFGFSLAVALMSFLGLLALVILLAPEHADDLVPKNVSAGYKLETAKEGRVFTADELFGNDWDTLCLLVPVPYGYGTEDYIWLSNTMVTVFSRHDVPSSFYEEMVMDMLVVKSRDKHDPKMDGHYLDPDDWSMIESKELVCTKNHDALVSKNEQGLWHPDFEYRFKAWK